MEAARLRLLLAQAERAERENRVREGELVEAAAAASKWGELAGRANAVMYQVLVDELPPLLAGLAAEAIRVEMKKVHSRVVGLLAEL